MNVFDKIKGGLIVSCQALETEPLYSSKIMARMAFAAKEGGAVGIRANTPEDIIAIKKEVDLPVIGLYKVDYDNSEIYITPTMKEIDAIMTAAPDIIALDATNRKRPDGSTIETFFPVKSTRICSLWQIVRLMKMACVHRNLGLTLLEPHFVVIRRIPKVQKFRAFQC